VVKHLMPETKKVLTERKVDRKDVKSVCGMHNRVHLI